MAQLRHARIRASEETIIKSLVGDYREEHLFTHLSVDGSFIQANANNASQIPREQLSEAAYINRNVRQYLDDLQRKNPLEPDPHQQDKVSTTDPDATYFSISDRAPTLGHFDNYLIDNASGVNVGVKATAARSSQQIASARTMLSDCIKKFGLAPKPFASATGYGKAEFLAWLENQGIAFYIPLWQYYLSGNHGGNLRTCMYIHAAEEEMILNSSNPKSVRRNHHVHESWGLIM